MTAAISIRANGFAEMAYVGETPWHGLGNALEKGASIDVWKKSAGMDWSIERAPGIFTAGEDVIYTGQDVLFRNDTKAPLGVVSKRYKAVQPGEVLEFFRDLTESNGYTLETAGTLFDGKRLWALASIGEEACVIGEDKIGGYLLLSTSSDGTLPTSARFTTIRVVCHNTLSAAVKGSSRKEVTIRHSTHFNSNFVKQELGLAKDAFADFLKSSRALASKHISATEAGNFVESLLLETDMVSNKDVTKSMHYRKIMDLFNGAGLGSTMESSVDTAWGLVNAVTEYVDHRAKASTDAHRLTSAWFGRGDKLKTEALERAVAL